MVAMCVCFADTGTSRFSFRDRVLHFAAEFVTQQEAVVGLISSLLEQCAETTEPQKHKNVMVTAKKPKACDSHTHTLFVRVAGSSAMLFPLGARARFTSDVRGPSLSTWQILQGPACHSFDRAVCGRGGGQECHYVKRLARGFVILQSTKETQSVGIPGRE